MVKRYFLGMGSVMWVDEDGNERYIPTYVDKDTDLVYFTTEELEDGYYADLDLVGEEPIKEKQGTLSKYWDDIKKLSGELVNG